MVRSEKKSERTPVSFQLIIRNQAQCDIAEILEDYEAKEKGLGAYFLLCLDASFEALRRCEPVGSIVQVVLRFSGGGTRIDYRFRVLPSYVSKTGMLK